MFNALTNFKRNALRPNVRYRGIVVDNDDPKQCGRVRIKVPRLVEFDEDDMHPWAIPAWSHGDGASDYTGKFDVPKINAFVSVMFQEAPDGTASVYSPIYGPFNSLETTILKDAKHHYPNRKVHFFSNGARVVIDTEDDSCRFYNPGETHIKSHGKLTIKCEETFVILSDVEIGLRAPEIALRARDHLIMESEDKLTMRCKGRMNIECRDDIYIRSRLNIVMDTEEEHIKLTTLNEKDSIGNIELTSVKDKIKITTKGEQEGRASSIEVLAKQHSVNIAADGKIEGQDSSVRLDSRKNNILLTARSELADKEMTAIRLNNYAYDVILEANSAKKAELRTPVIKLDNPDGSGQITFAKGRWPSKLRISADELVDISSSSTVSINAPSLNIAVG